MEIDVKQDTFIKYVFRFLEPCRPILALKLAKSDNISKKMYLKDLIWVSKKRELDAEF
jgi:hypothetical protein